MISFDDDLIGLLRQREERDVRRVLIEQKHHKHIENFVTSRVAESWVVEFTLYGDRCQLIAQRGGVRKFSRINGVLGWMEKMGVKEFRVVL